MADQAEEQLEEDLDAVATELEDLAGMELDIDGFIEAFRTNAQLLRKVAITTGVPEDGLRSLQDDDLAGLFQAMDKDYSGTISFDEFVEGLVQIRQGSRADLDEQFAAEEEAVMDDAYVEAANAFEDAMTSPNGVSYGIEGELGLSAFVDALSDPIVVEKVSYASGLPTSWFDELDTMALAELFQQIDADSSGTISFVEWVEYLTQIRKQVFEQEKADEADAMDAVMGLAEEAMDEGDEDWSGEFDLAEFLTAFRTNRRFLRKVSLATDVPVEEYEWLADEELEALFEALDTDFSGTVSFDEFVKGLVDIRLSRQAAKKEEGDEEQEAVLDDAYVEAAGAFEDFGYEGELDSQQFVDALCNPDTASKVARATGLPMSFFDSLDYERMLALFDEIDADASGTVSFQEWVDGLVKIREQTYQQEKVEEAELTEAVTALAEEAMDGADEDWAGEFEFDTFMQAFRSNAQFLRKISLATEVPVEEFQMMCDDDIESLFTALDTDFSGTVSFEEFVKGLVDIRRSRMEEKKEADVEREKEVLEDAYMDAAEAFDDADFGIQGELDLAGFTQALNDPTVVEKVAWATGLPVSWFAALDASSLEELFQQIDTDSSGTVSFQEWVAALVKIREQTYHEEKEAEAEATQAVIALAEAALDEADEDWDGEFDLGEFITAFRGNPRFVSKISAATGVSGDEFTSLGDSDLVELFESLDTDFSGTLSFEEFVKGLVQIRLTRKAEQKAESEAAVAEEEAKKAEEEAKKAKRAAKRLALLPQPYILSEEIRKLPPLADSQKENIAEVYSKYREDNWGFVCTADSVAKLLQDLFLVVDRKAAETYIERAFPGRDLTPGMKLADCEVLYQVALQAQPLWTDALTRSASAAALTANDVHSHEDQVRQVFNRHADKSGKLSLQKVGQFLSDTGVMDSAAYTPRFLDEFQVKHKLGSVSFPEVIGLCNTAFVHTLKKSDTKLSSLVPKESLLPKHGMLASLKADLGTEATGLAAQSLRRRRQERTNWASQGMLVVGSGGLTRSNSNGMLRKNSLGSLTGGIH